ncbi:hypothetical protein [Pelagicoccus mobilis]|uniref:Uncharacterized protein n=1 Tax=Pelagicoccus mobilis TaxID=415221 RepID=A0A934RSB9_9BACT|nr:hypothetical protein [Pelagicoccus mobilis]MBK1875503.1 hypothetical protein [Pelagicoccus mobilis]
MNTLTASPWTISTYLEEPSYVSKSADGAWLAHVSIPRARLTYFGPANLSQNLLRVTPPPLPQHGPHAPSWGGHIVWMLSDALPHWKWPPLREWEYTPAAQIENYAGALSLIRPQVHPKFPALGRSYHWEGNTLVCESFWTPTQSAHHLAIHTLHVPFNAQIELSQTSLKGTFKELDGFSITEHPVADRPGLTLDQTTAKICPSSQSAKYAFPTQEIAAHIDNYRLSMQRLNASSNELDNPFTDLLTHVWIASQDLESPFIEIEQASPYLTPGLDGYCRFGISLQAESL